MKMNKKKTLEQLTRGEWEAICERCGRCCYENMSIAIRFSIQRRLVVISILKTTVARCTQIAPDTSPSALS